MFFDGLEGGCGCSDDACDTPAPATDDAVDTPVDAPATEEAGE